MSHAEGHGMGYRDGARRRQIGAMITITSSLTPRMMMSSRHSRLQLVQSRTKASDQMWCALRPAPKALLHVPQKAAPIACFPLGFRLLRRQRPLCASTLGPERVEAGVGAAVPDAW